MQKNRDYIKRALDIAQKAAQKGDVPVGCIIVKDGIIVSEAYNQREADKNALYHAELLAIHTASRKLNTWRLDTCTLYVTMEPCVMCAGAIINARIPYVVFGAYDQKAGAFGGLLDINLHGLNHKPEIYGGIMEDECSDILKRFFSAKRIS